MDCIVRRYTGMCDINFSVNDRFTKPFDLYDNNPNFDFDLARPYNIRARWSAQSEF